MLLRARLCSVLLLVPLLGLATQAQVPGETPSPLLSAYTISLQNGAAAGSGSSSDPSALPAPVFAHLVQSFLHWKRYKIVADPAHADLNLSVNQTADPDHRVNLRIVNRATGFDIWQRSVDLDPSQHPAAFSNHALDFLLLRLRQAVNHPAPNTDLTVP